MKKLLLLFISLYTFSVQGQKIPPVYFNHVYLVVDTSDLLAIQKSAFIKNEFAPLVIKNTKAGNGQHWTGTYLFGLDNYFEIFDSAAIEEPVENAGIGFSVDSIGELNQLNASFINKYKTEISLRERETENKKIPWFNILSIDDSVFYSNSHISSWVMEYRPEYFSYKKLPLENNKLTRSTYLSEYREIGKNKIFKRFTGITLRVTDKEKKFYSAFLINCWYQRIDENNYRSRDGFTFHFIQRNRTDKYAIGSLRFENNFSHKGMEDVSKNIRIIFYGETGEITFR